MNRISGYERYLEAYYGKDEIDGFKVWEKYLEENLTFPFDAEIEEGDDGDDEGPLKIGDGISVKKISGSDDFYGIIVEFRFGRKKYAYPLCDIEVIDKRTK